MTGAVHTYRLHETFTTIYRNIRQASNVASDRLRIVTQQACTSSCVCMGSFAVLWGSNRGRDFPFTTCVSM